MTQKLFIIYYVYIDTSSNWRAIVGGQLSDLKKYKLIQNASLYIHITSTINKEVSNYIHKIAPKATISTSIENQYEYPAINLLHTLAKDYPDAIFLYFHTKGMSYKTKERLPQEKALLHYTFKDWKKVIQLLQSSKELNKAGLFISQDGVFIWYNFWYAKGHFLANLETPIICDDRYYYESWLSKTTVNNYHYEDSYCISRPKTNKGYEPYEANIELRKIVQRQESKQHIKRLRKFLRKIKSVCLKCQ